MHRRFWLGMLAGATITAAVITGHALLSDSARQATLPRERRPSELAVLERDLALMREQSSAHQAKVEQLRSERARVEAALRESRTEKPPAAGPPDPVPVPPTFPRRVEAGKDLPPEVAAWLDLNPGQQKLVNERLRAETADIYSLIRRLASEDPSVLLPPTDGPGLLMALFASPDYYEDRIKLIQIGTGDPDIRERRKMFYLEDIVDPTSRLFRMAEESIRIRARTLQDLGPVLSEEQQRKISSLLGRGSNFEGMPIEWRENMLLRRPR